MKHSNAQATVSISLGYRAEFSLSEKNELLVVQAHHPSDPPTVINLGPFTKQRCYSLCEYLNRLAIHVDEKPKAKTYVETVVQDGVAGVLMHSEHMEEALFIPRDKINQLHRAIDNATLALDHTFGSDKPQQFREEI